MTVCSICQRNFAVNELLESNQNEFFCKECFKYEYCAGKQLQTKKKIITNKCEGDSTITNSRKMFTLNELSTIKRDRNRKNGFFTSKKPLQCPHLDCNRYVSVFDLIAHFQHEHMEVSIVQTLLDERNPLTFYPKDIRYGVKQCLLLLNVLPATDTANSSRLPEKSQIPVSITVLASRIAAAQLGEESNETILTEDEANVFSCINDKIIIWTSSNIPCNYSYTVAVSTVSEDIRVKYYGPMLQLGNAPEKLCMEGHCLILSYYHFFGMSENGLKPLQLDVIVHSED